MSVASAFVLATLVICDTADAQTDDPIFIPEAGLEVDAPYQLIGESAKLTATASYIPTPAHYIRIYDKTTGTHLKTCNANATSCSVSVVQDEPTKRTYKAYIAKQGGGFPPPGIAGSASEDVDVTWSSSVVLNTDKTRLWEGEEATLTAESYGFSAWQSQFVLIRDESGKTVGACPWSTSCSTPVTEPNGTVEHTYHALQAVWINGTPNPPQLWRESNHVSVRWDDTIP
jgi:hypothetical protein